MKSNKQVKHGGDLHKTINWAVSIIVAAFAVWTVNVSAANRALVKEAMHYYTDVYNKVDEIKANLNTLESMCGGVSGIPTTTISNQ